MFSTFDEEDITGELTAEMNSAIEDAAAPRWCNQFFVHEEVRVNQQGKLGKRRKRVDIEIESSNVRPADVVGTTCASAKCICKEHLQQLRTH
ncbi:MAG: hypothetical protein R3C56_34150 [Pirellulaceae bacterium]